MRRPPGRCYPYAYSGDTRSDYTPLLLGVRTTVALTMTRPTWAPPTHHGHYATEASLSIWLYTHGGPAAIVVAVQRAYSGAT